LNQLTRFRLEPLKEVVTVPGNLIDSIIPQMSSPEVLVSDELCKKTAVRLRATHLLNQKFEISQQEKVLHYYVEITSSKSNQIVFNMEKDIPFDRIGPEIDTCLLTALKAIQPEMYPETERFFGLSMLSPNFKIVKQLGEVYILESDKLKGLDNELAREYEKLIEKDPLLLLANYPCAMAFFRAKQYVKSAKYLKQLLDLTPIQSSLFITLAQSYRLAGQYQDALNVTLSCDRMRLRSIPFLLEKAMAFEGMNQRGSALNTYLQILTVNASQPQALLFLAQQRNNEANYTEGLQYADKLLIIEPSNGKAGFEKGRALSALGKYDEAFAILKNAAQNLPEDPYIQQWLGDLCIRKQLYPEAVDHYKKASKSAPDNFDFYIKTSNALQLSNKNNEALKLLRDISTRFKDKKQIYKEIGLLEYKAGNLDSSLAALSLFCRTDSTLAEVYLILGHIFNKKSDLKAAMQNYSKSMKLSGPTIECKLSIADVHLKTKNPSAARKLLEEVLAERAEKNANRLMGEAYLQTGDMRNALSYYKKERELHGDDPVVQEKIASLYFFQGFYAPAKTEYQYLAKLVPQHPEAYYYLAIFDLRESLVSSAEQYLKKAEKLGNGNALIHYNLGINFENNKMLDNAISSYNKCLSFEPANQNALLNLADVYIKAEKDSAAAETFIKLFNIDNNKYSANLANAGHIFFKLSIFDKAVSTYSLFLDKKYSDFSVNVGYATIMYSRNDYNKVISLLKSINGTWLKDDKVLTMLADSYFKTGQYVLSLPHLSSLLSLNDSNQYAVKHSAISLEKAKDTLKSISMYERYLTLPPEKDRSDIAFHLGELYEAKKMDDKAISQYDNNIKTYPEDLRNHTQIGALYYKKKNFVKAQMILETAVAFPTATPRLKKMMAQTYAAQNNYPNAIVYYDKYLAAVSNDASGWKELGICHFFLNDYPKAIPAFSKARELSSTEDFEV
ncbi:MAG TPA: tetratricopeptide repeat protein, partial [Chitinispirillaceae bacterium]|nr:tetratricopeptide repeat protein [Chitinispirillaceae bacterium]